MIIFERVSNGSLFRSSDQMSDVSDQEEEPVAQVIFEEAKNLKNITVDRYGV